MDKHTEVTLDDMQHILKAASLFRKTLKKGSRLRDRIGQAVEAANAVFHVNMKLDSKPYADDQVISVMVAQNPKKPDSKAHGRFAHYRNGMTVAEALVAGITREDFEYDTWNRFIAIR